MTNPEKRSRKEVSNETRTERASRLLRNINVLGAVAAAGAGIALPALAVPLNVYAGFNAVQAGGFEWARRSAKKARQRKDTPKDK